MAASRVCRLGVTIAGGFADDRAEKDHGVVARHDGIEGCNVAQVAGMESESLLALQGQQ